MQDFSFQSARLFTRTLEDQDAKPLYDMYSDAEAMKYRGSKPMVEEGAASKMIADSYLVLDTCIKLRLAICHEATGVLLGTLLLVYTPDADFNFEIGFSFGKSHWGKGYATEAVKMVLDELSSHEINQVVAYCKEGNQGSMRVLEKCGFVWQGIDGGVHTYHWFC